LDRAAAAFERVNPNGCAKVSRNFVGEFV